MCILDQRRRCAGLQTVEHVQHRLSAHSGEPFFKLPCVLVRIDRALSNPPYNYVIHTAPFRDERNDYYHWHIELMPKLTNVAGFEWGSGFYINPTPPEDAAKFLREIKL